MALVAAVTVFQMALMLVAREIHRPHRHLKVITVARVLPTMRIGLLPAVAVGQVQLAVTAPRAQTVATAVLEPRRLFLDHR